MNVSLRPVEDSDLDTIYQQVTDPPERTRTTSVRFECWRKPGSDALASTATSHRVAVRRSRKRFGAST